MPQSASPLQRDHILGIIDAALAAVDPRWAVLSHMSVDGDVLRIGRRNYRLSTTGRIIVVGAGKAGVPMAAAVFDSLGDRISGGSVNVKYGHTANAGVRQARFGHGRAGHAPAPEEPVITGAASLLHTGPIEIREAAHPVPDAAGLSGAGHIAAMLSGLTERDLVIVLLSGGGSALLPSPVPGLNLADLQGLTNVLLRCGATINELNVARKHCSQLQGGGLARLAAPAQVAALILSDVVGSPLDTIASGPTVPDRSTYAEVLEIFERYGVAEQVPAGVLAHLRRGVAGDIPETPKPGDALFERVDNVIVGDNASAARAAVAEAQRQGFQSVFLSSFIQGEAREVGRAVAGLAQGIAAGASDIRPPACLVLGGETTVTVRGEGLGGRNQELALAAAIALDGYPLPRGVDAAIVAIGTDGTDGPTDAAGGIAAPNTLARGRALGLDGRAALSANDSYHYLSALGDLLITGPTNTNVNDLILLLIK